MAGRSRGGLEEPLLVPADTTTPRQQRFDLDEIHSQAEPQVERKIRDALRTLDAERHWWQRLWLFRTLSDFFWQPKRVGIIPAVYGLVQAVCAMLSLTNLFFTASRLEFWPVTTAVVLYLAVSTWYLLHLQLHEGRYIPKSSASLVEAFFRDQPDNAFMVSYEWGSGGAIAERIASVVPNTWLDVERLLPGASVQRSCRRAARRCKVAFVLLTREYLMSRNCRLELAELKQPAADGAGRAIVFVEAAILAAFRTPEETLERHDRSRAALAHVLAETLGDPYFQASGWEHAGRILSSRLRAHAMELLQLELEEYSTQAWYLVSTALRRNLHAVPAPLIEPAAADFLLVLQQAAAAQLAQVRKIVAQTVASTLDGARTDAAAIRDLCLGALGDWMVPEASDAVVFSLGGALQVLVDTDLARFSETRAARMGHDRPTVCAADARLVERLVAQVGQLSASLPAALGVLANTGEPEEYRAFARVSILLQHLAAAVGEYRGAAALNAGVVWLEELRQGPNYVCLDGRDFEALATRPAAVILRRLAVWRLDVLKAQGSRATPAVQRTTAMRRLFQQHTPCINEQWSATLLALSRQSSRFNLPLFLLPVLLAAVVLLLVFTHRTTALGNGQEDDDLLLEVKVAIALVEGLTLLFLLVIAGGAHSSGRHWDTFKQLLRRLGLRKDLSIDILPDAGKLLAVLKHMGILSGAPISVYRGNLLPATFSELSRSRVVSLASSWESALYSLVQLPQDWDSSSKAGSVRYAFELRFRVVFAAEESLLDAVCTAINASRAAGASWTLSCSGVRCRVGRCIRVTEARLSGGLIHIGAELQCASPEQAQEALVRLHAMPTVSMQPIFGKVTRLDIRCAGESSIQIAFVATINDFDLRERASSALSLRTERVQLVHKFVDSDAILITLRFSDFEDYGEAHTAAQEMSTQAPHWFPVQLGVAELDSDRGAAVVEQDPVKCLFWTRQSYEELIQNVHRRFSEDRSSRLQKLLGQDRVLCITDLIESEHGLIPGPETVLAPLLVSSLALDINGTDSVSRGRFRFTELHSPDEIIAHSY